MTTIDGRPMTTTEVNRPVGASLRIAPSFRATVDVKESGIETTIEAHYKPDPGRYVITSVLNRATQESFDSHRLLHTPPQAILRAAVPYCITVRLDDSADSPWLSIADLTGTEGRIIPQWMADAVTKYGVKDERWDVIEILYGTSALSDSPPVKLIALELGIPERTATSWIAQARDAGRLGGLLSKLGRPADE